MLPPEINDLLERAQKLGNHYQKNIRIIQKILPDLHEYLARKGFLEHITLLQPSYQYAEDMSFITNLGIDQRKILDFLGCYFSLQLLWSNLSFLDWLDFNLNQKIPTPKLYRRFMLRSGLSFRKLTAAYMQNLLKVLKEQKSLPQFVIMGVGTRSDQDDIDVGIVDDGSENRAFLNQVIDKMGIEMIRFASNFHFHLSEHVGSQVYSASIQEYQSLLENKIGNFVILTEMLGAAYIIGDKQLFELFQKEVTQRYYESRNRNKYHEGYLRGIIGEVGDLLARPVDKEFLHPKFDGLRIIKNLVYAYKTLFGISKVNPWEILDELKRLQPELRKYFQKLEGHLSFLEIFRYLYQQLVVQEEHINILDGIILENLQRLALTLHYINFGSFQAVYQLLDDYRKHVQHIRQIIPVFLEDLSKHLVEISTFKHLFTKHHRDKKIIEKLLNELDFFEGVHFWEDLFYWIKSGSVDSQSVMLRELCGMFVDDRTRIFNNLSVWAGNNPEFIFRFCTLLETPGYLEKCDLQNELLSVYLLKYFHDTQLIENLIHLYRKNPALFCRTLQCCHPDNLRKLREFICQKSLRGDIASDQKNIADLIELIQNCSYYFKRIIKNVFSQFPDYACFIRTPDLLCRESQKLLRYLPFKKSFTQKKIDLATFFDLKFLEIGLETFNGASIQEINHGFTDFVNQYIRHLFEICLHTVIKDRRLRSRILSRCLIYSCGGNGREQAFDDDFDLIIVEDFQNSHERSLFREIIALFNSELVKRGTLPHLRFTHHFGEYSCPYEGLKELLQTDYPERHIDRSQILECRLMVGDKFFHQKFIKEIIKNIIFAESAIYIWRMIKEIKERHSISARFRDERANIKECKGGLRDIEMITLIYKTYYQLLETNPYRLIHQFCSKNKEFKTNWLKIENALQFLQRFRYVYRLTIAAEDQINQDLLEQVARVFHPDLPAQVNKSNWIWQRLLSHRKTVWHEMQFLINKL
jgi:hypothetical protein